MNRFRTSMLLLFTGILIALVFFGVQMQVPTVLAYPNYASFNTAAPMANTCAVSGCHAGTVSPTSAVITFPSGSYTPGGPAIPFTITIPGTSFRTWGYQLTAVLASNLASPGGFFTAGDNGTTGSTGSSGTFNLTWTPPPAGTKDSVSFYLTGDNTSGVGSNNTFSTAMATLTPAAAATPDFSLSASSVTITDGASGTSTITVTPTNGFTGSIALSASGLPSGVSFSPTSITGTTMVTLTATSTATTGTVPVTITGTSGTLSHTATLNLTVNAAVVPNFSLSASPYTLTQGGNGSSTITVTPQNGFTGSVMLAASTLPTGVTGSFNPASATTTSSLTFIASSTAATGNFPVTITGTSGSLTHTATLSLTVNASGSGSGTVTVSPMSLSFNYQMGGSMPSSKMLTISSTSGSTSYTAKETDPWLTISPTSGTSSLSTPGYIRGSVNPSGMSAGTYGAQINITTTGGKTITVPVSLTITSATGGGGTTPGSMYAQPYVSSSRSGTLAAAWVNYLGASPNNPNDPHNQGLVLATSATSPSGAMAGATIQGVSGMNLTELSFDFRTDIPCTSGSPLFQVVTMDGTTHTYGGCTSRPTTPASSAPMGWTHVQFDLTQAPSTLNSQVKSISLVLEKGSSSSGSIAVIDNIQINKVPVGKGAASTPNPRDD